ncbi:MAG: hypothetical protein ACRDTA_23950 [Pseudonocardiaceae bacterium]
MRALLRSAIDDGGDVRCAALPSLSPRCAGGGAHPRVETALAGRRRGQRIRIVPTDERFTKLVGAILNDTGSGSEHIATRDPIAPL